MRRFISTAGTAAKRAPWPMPGCRALFRRFAHACERYRQRQHLAELDADQLADIGLTRRDVDRECARPFWEV